MFFEELMVKDNLKKVYENLMEDIDLFNEARKVNIENNELFWGACILYAISSEEPENDKETNIEKAYSEITSKEKDSFIPGTGKESSFIKGTLKISKFLKEKIDNSTIFEIHRLGSQKAAKTLSINNPDELEILHEYHFGEDFTVYLHKKSIINNTIKKVYKKAVKSEVTKTFASWNPSDLYLVDLNEKDQIINKLNGLLNLEYFDIALLNSELIDFYEKRFLMGISLKEIKEEVKYIKNPEERLGAPFYRYISVSDRNVEKMSIEYSDFIPSEEMIFNHTEKTTSIFFTLFRTRGQFNIRSFGKSYAVECVFKGAGAIVGKYPANLLLRMLQQENNKITSLKTPNDLIRESFISLYSKLEYEEKQKLLLELYKGCAKLSDGCAPHLDIFGSNKYYDLIKQQDK